MDYKYVLGFMNYCSHDPAACILKLEHSGTVVDYIFAEEGFLSRKKKSYQFPLRSINYCLQYFSIPFHDLSAICVDYMDHKRLHRTSDNYRLLIGDFIRAHLDFGKNTEIIFCDSHHTAHAYSTFLATNLDESAVLIVDGLGSSQQTHTFYKANNNGIYPLCSQHGNGIGTLYSLITSQLGFESGEEGKTMGLAAYGLDHPDQDFYLPDLKALSRDHIRDYSHIMDRNPSPMLRINIPPVTSLSDVYLPYYSRLAHNLQLECEETVVYLAGKCMELSRSNNLCLAGGVALNCVANEKVAALTPGQFFVQPASGDTGIAIGLALYAAHQVTSYLPRLTTSFNCDHRGSFYPYTSDEKNLINSQVSQSTGINFTKYIENISVPMNVDHIVNLLIQKKVGSLYQGAIEIGPRALGHRSFLADCRDADMKRILNLKIKHREPYRPFAPIVLEEDYSTYFHGPIELIHRYMLGAPTCTEFAKKTIPAVVHVDGSARVQVVTKDNGLIFEILSAYKRATGVSVLINTSFNDNNEPIVFSWLDALLCFFRTSCDFLIINNRVVLRELVQNLEKEVAFLSQARSNWLQTFTLKSLHAITSIGQCDHVSLRDFAIYNHRLSSFYRQERLAILLLDFLESCSCSYGTLITDEYHLGILNSLDRLFPSSRILDRLHIHIVSDSLKDLERSGIILDSGYILLYNVSSYLGSSCHSFYKSSDRKLTNSLPQPSSVLPMSREPQSPEFLSSYECDPDKTINDWINDL